jgi:hypothetical protein
MRFRTYVPYHVPYHAAPGLYLAQVALDERHRARGGRNVF